MRLGLVAVVVLLAGCAQPAAPKLDVMHVHGLAFDEASGDLFLATHHGLARGQLSGKSWSWGFVGDPYDYMGFSQDANRSGTFYSSGHPDNPYAYGGTLLGLRRSLDGGVTWEQRSLKGEVDFHALTALQGGEGWLAGAWRGATKVSRDGGATWANFFSPPGDVLALTSGPESLLAGTTTGLYETRDLDGFSSWTRLPGPSQGVVSSVAVSSDGQVLLASTGDGSSGGAYRSSDGGVSWAKLESGSLQSAAPVLFAFAKQDSSHAFAALASGKVFESKDSGATWRTLR